MKVRNDRFKNTINGILVLLSVAIAMTLLYSIANVNFYKSVYPKKYEDIVNEVSIKYNLKPQLIYAVIKTESNFDPNAKSPAGAIGLMQITEDTFNWLQSMTKENLDLMYLYDPYVNINYGAKFLSVLRDKYYSDEVVLSAYNAGMTSVERWLKDENISLLGEQLNYIPYKETRNYVKKVIKTQDMYEKLYFKDNLWRLT